MSVNSLVKGFILTQRTDYKSPRTVDYYGSNLRRFLWYVALQKWTDDVRMISEWNIREFLEYVGGEGHRWGLTGNGSETSRKKASYCTVHHYYCVLKSFFNWCVREGFIHESPLVKIKMKNPRLNVVQPYSSQDILKLIEVCDNDRKNNAQLTGSRNKAIVLMLLDTGLRVSELVGIKLGEIDSERGWLKVKGKGAKERVVRIGTTTQKALWRYLVFREKNKCQELWITEEGNPMKVGGIQIMIKRLKERAGVTSQGNCHKFRHTFALNFLRKDRNPFNLQYLLGHSDLRMVKHYVSTLGMEDALKAHESASPADMLGLR
ncbi:MAG: tyrosine-type recombinase/integrase [Dehalococcoidales bacterium]|jgi:site-specific recombinase XerD